MYIVEQLPQQPVQSYCRRQYVAQPTHARDVLPQVLVSVRPNSTRTLLERQWLSSR